MTAAQLLEALASYSLQVLLVVLAGTLLDRTLARATDRCAMWNVCFAGILILACAALFLPRLHLVQPWSLLRPQELLNAAAMQSTLGKILVGIWSIGASAALLRWIARSYWSRRALCRCEQLPKAEVRRLLTAAGSDIADDNLPILLVSDDCDGPFCRQLHRPTVVLPRFLLKGDRDDVRNVLLHEMEHLKSNHPVQLFVQQLAQVICWFHPAVWRAAGRVSLVREFVCDDAAAAEGANSAAYLRTLLHIAERCERSNQKLAIAFGRTSSEIAIRARRLVELARQRNACGRGILGRRAAVGILAVVVCVASQISLPADPLASSRAAYSPWPRWSAGVLHSFGCGVRDYEQFDRHVQVHELQHPSDDALMTRDATRPAPPGGT